MLELGAIDICEGFTYPDDVVVPSGGLVAIFRFSRRSGFAVTATTELLFSATRAFHLAGFAKLFYKMACFSVTWDGMIIWF